MDQEEIDIRQFGIGVVINGKQHFIDPRHLNDILQALANARHIDFGENNDLLINLLEPAQGARQDGSLPPLMIREIKNKNPEETETTNIDPGISASNVDKNLLKPSLDEITKLNDQIRILGESNVLPPAPIPVMLAPNDNEAVENWPEPTNERSGNNQVLAETLATGSNVDMNQAAVNLLSHRQEERQKELNERKMLIQQKESEQSKNKSLDDDNEKILAQASVMGLVSETKKAIEFINSLNDEAVKEIQATNSKNPASLLPNVTANVPYFTSIQNRGTILPMIRNPYAFARQGVTPLGNFTLLILLNLK
jgi:hypothetical protein